MSVTPRITCGKCNEQFPDKPLLREHLLDQHNMLTHHTKWLLHRLARKDAKVLKLCYLSGMYPHIPPFFVKRAPTRVLQLSPPSEESDAFVRSIESWKSSERNLRWFAVRSLFKKGGFSHLLDHIHLAPNSILDMEQAFALCTPDSQPTLSLATTWSLKNGGTMQLLALIDTGCNTSLIVADALCNIVDALGNEFNVTNLTKPISLLTASGNTIDSCNSATLTFKIADTNFSHCFYIMNKLPIAEKLILGMDFLLHYGVCLDMASGLITFAEPCFPRDMRNISLFAIQDLTLPAHTTTRVLLKMNFNFQPMAAEGYLSGDKHLPDECFLWHGVQTLRDGQTSAFVTNISAKDIRIKATTPIATWEADECKEIYFADHIVQTALQCNVITSSSNGDDWEWCDEHLYLDLEKTPVGVPDPPVDASIDQLATAWVDTLQRLDAAQATDSDACDERRTLLQQLERINTRIKRYGDESSTRAELPADLTLDVGYDHLTVDEKQQLKDVLSCEATFFMKGKYPKVIRTEQPVRIDVGKAAPRVSGFRRLNHEEQMVVNEYVEKLISADVVEPCNGPWSSPILLVPKKDGGLRAVADLRKVNECVLADSYTMPDTQDLLDQLAGAKWFTSLDLSSAFWQLPLAEESRDCTAFMTKTHGLLRWKTLPMGFKNASAYFQREIDSALKGLRFTCCVVYIDDVCIYSYGSLQDHLNKVRAVLRALRVVGFSGNPKKCKFAQTEVIFLGHRVSDGKVYPLEDKVKAMLEYKRPASLRELRGFLGLMSYYRKFIKDFAAIAAPLSDLTKQKRLDKSARELKSEANTPWKEGIWSDKHQEAFETLKGALLCRPILVLPNKAHPWRLATDASNVAMGAVLSQIDDNHEEHPIGYYSRKLSPSEVKWSIWELELAAVVWATTVCRHYLRGVHFELVTDSKVVAALIRKEVPKRRENLLVRLFEFDFTVTHRKGELNRNADFFSRWAAYKEWEEEKLMKVCCTKIFVCQEDISQQDQTLMRHLALNPLVTAVLPENADNPDFGVLRRVIVEEQRKDPRLGPIIAKLETAEQVRLELEDESTQPDSMDIEEEVRHQTSTTSSRVETPIPVVIGDYSREEKVDAAVLVVLTETSTTNTLPPTTEAKQSLAPRLPDTQLYKYKLVGPDKLLVKACCYRSAKKEQPVVIWPIVVPTSMVAAIMGLFHGDKSPLSHGGKHKTYGALRKRFTWKGMAQSVRQWIGACHKCLRRKRRPPDVQKYNVHPKAVAPMNRICIDFVGPLIPTTRGNTHVLTIYDPFSHWPSAYAVNSLEAKTVIACLKKHIAVHSVPAEVLSDQGRNLMAAAVKEFLADMGAKKYETSAYHPQSNGSVERFHYYLAAALTTAINERQAEWDEHLDSILFAYRTTPIDGLDITPFEVIYGRNPNLPIDNMLFRENHSEPVETMEEYLELLDDNQYHMFRAIQQMRQQRFDRNKRAAGEHKTVPSYEVGEKVYLDFPKGRFRPLGGSTKLSPFNDGPYTVLEKMSDGLIYKVQHDRKGLIHNASVSRMIRAPPMIIPDNAVDLPHTNFWKQLEPGRADRINDLSEEQHERRQQELAKANDEIEEKEVVRKEGEQEFEMEEELVEPENLEEELRAQQQKQRKRGRPKAKPSIELEEKKEEKTSDNTATKPKGEEKKRKQRKHEEPMELRPQYQTKASDRTERARRRAEHAGRRGEDPAQMAWISLAPFRNLPKAFVGRRDTGVHASRPQRREILLAQGIRECFTCGAIMDVQQTMDHVCANF